MKKQNNEIKKSYLQEKADKKQGIDYKSGIGFGGCVTPPAQKGTNEKREFANIVVYKVINGVKIMHHV